MLVQAALDDLEALAEELRAGEDALRPITAGLRDAIERARAGNTAFLTVRPELDGDLDRRSARLTSLADGCDRAALRFRAAGNTAELRATLPGAAGGATARLEGVRLATALFESGSVLRRRAEALFDPPVGPPPFVVDSRREELAIGLVADARWTLIRDVLSDGTVRVTKVSGAAAGIGPGAGASCSVKVDGFTITDVELGAAASTRFSGGTTETWVFDDEAAADGWLEDHRALVLVDPVGLHHLGLGGAGTPDERTEEVSGAELLDAFAALGLLDASGTVRAGTRGEATVRRNDDGTLTLSTTAAVDVAAEGRVGLDGSLQAGSRTTVELTVDPGRGELVSFEQRIVELDEAGRALTVDGAVASGSASAAATRLNGLHLYESTFSLDFSDPRTAAALQTGLGADVSSLEGKLTAIGAALVLDPRAVQASSLLVTERTVPTDQQWAVGCDIDAIVGQVPISAATGTSHQRTVAAAFKPPGETRLRPAV